jgi:hypothetical protein
VVTTTEVVETAVPVINASDNNSSSVNVGAIVGGVVGGVAFIVLLVGLFIWWRKKTRFDDFEANLFDPDHNVKRPMSTADPHTDILTTAAVPEAARNITPYAYGNQQPAGSMNGTGSSAGQRSSVGWQPEARPPSNYYAYDNASSAGGPHYPPNTAGNDGFPNPYSGGFVPQSLVPGAVAAGVGGAALGAAALNRGPTVSSTSSSYYPPASYPPSHVSPTSTQYPQSMHGSMPVPMPVPTPAPSNPRAAKEQEAFRRTHGSGKGGWSVSNQSSGLPSSGGEEGEVPQDAEIPPTYESIRHDNPTPVQPGTSN